MIDDLLAVVELGQDHIVLFLEILELVLDAFETLGGVNIWVEDKLLFEKRFIMGNVTCLGTSKFGFGEKGGRVGSLSSRRGLLAIHLLLLIKYIELLD